MICSIQMQDHGYLRVLNANLQNSILLGFGCLSVSGLRLDTRESMNIVEFWSMALYCLFDFLGPIRSQLFVFVCDSSTTDA